MCIYRSRTGGHVNTDPGNVGELENMKTKLVRQFVWTPKMSANVQVVTRLIKLMQTSLSTLL